MPEKLLDAFKGLFSSKYRHRVSTHGDAVASQFYEDIYDYAAASGASPQYIRQVDAATLVYNKANKVTGQLIGGIRVRRGDGLLGQSVPGQPVHSVPGYIVKRGKVANIRMGVEAKILSTAMARQFDRLIGDIWKQQRMFKAVSPDSITVVLIGVNHSPTYRSYEGEKSYDSSPQKEAARTMERLGHELTTYQGQESYDEILFLPFAATNVAPYAFDWLDWSETTAAYNAALVRLANLYQSRFG